MLDIRLIRSDPEGVRAALSRRGPGVADAVDAVLSLDEQWRAVTAEAEALRAEQNQASRALKGAPTPEQRAQLAELAARGRGLSDEETRLRVERDTALAALPNLPHESAPAQDTVLREVGEGAASGRDHLELAGEMIDMERGARLSGSRFAYLRGPLVMLELALVRYAMEKLMVEGFEPVIPPVLVREAALYGTGFLPDTEQQIYHLPEDELYLVGTSEVALASLHRDEILAADDLPLRYAGFSSCFRREAGAAGKDTRGIFRVHQFDKVEMFSFVAPEEGEAEHQRLLAIEESIMADLQIPYRVVAIAVDDLGASAAAKYDVEAWLPGQGRYRELTSCSNTTDYQARRLDVRYRAGEGRPATLHTLNGTAVAVGRTIIALLENGQRDDGSIALPPALVALGAPAELPCRGLDAAATAGRPEGRGSVGAQTARSGRGALSSSTISAARGGPQVAIRARMRTPNVFQGRTVRREVAGSWPSAAPAMAAAKPVGPWASESAGTSSSAIGRLTASCSVIPRKLWASRDMAWTRRATSTTRNASRSFGTASSRASSSRPKSAGRAHAHVRRRRAAVGRGRRAMPAEPQPRDLGSQAAFNEFQCRSLVHHHWLIRDVPIRTLLAPIRGV